MLMPLWMTHMAGPTGMSRIAATKGSCHLPVSSKEPAGHLIEACAARQRASVHPGRHRSRKPWQET